MSGKKPKTIAVFGASGGVGRPLTEHLLNQGHEVYSFCRRKVDLGHFVEFDATDRAQIDGLADRLEDVQFDALIYTAGTWEDHAFTDQYSFAKTSRAENRNVLEVNLLAPILITHALLDRLNRETGAKLIYFGAVSGLDHYGSPEVTNTATKFGLIGMVQGLHKSLSGTGISCTVINPEYLETEEVLQDMVEGTIEEQTPIPLDDIHRTVDFVLATSKRSAITEINIEQTHCF